MSGHLYRVGVPTTAQDAEQAASFILDALGADANSINDVGGLTVELVSDEKQYLVCKGCGESFDSIATAHEHGTFIPGPDPSWCGEDGFDILPESEAM